MLSWIFLVALLYTGSCVQAQCKVGNDYSTESRASDFEGKWHLNVALPATCSGSIRKYKVRFYTNGLSEETRYDITLAIWKPVNSTTYQKDSTTVKYYRHEYDDKRRKKRATNTFSSFTAVGVRKGSVIGVYLDTSKPLPVIGVNDGSAISGNPVGACVTATSVSASILTCNGTNEPNTIVHAETDITTVDCGNSLPTVANATYTLVDGDTQYGARVQYSCNTGYSPTGTDTVSCQLNGNWSSPNLTCSLVNCSDPGTPQNGQRTGSVFTYESFVLYSCNEGYQLSGYSSAYCQANGYWNTTLPNCTIVNCTDSGAPQNGQRTGSVFTYESIVLYSCNEGYQLSGDSSAYCQANGYWNATLPNCTIVNCGDPPSIEHATYNGNTEYGAVVQYSCDTGYNLTGSDTISCQANGDWTPSNFICNLVNCTDPGIPTNGSRIGEDFGYNSILTYYCNTGYNLTGSSSLICLSNGQWNTSVPSCPPVNCGDPGTPTNGISNADDYTYLTVVTFSCDTGYSLIGNGSMTCLSNGEWSDTIPSCVLVDCSDPGTPDNGQRIGSNFSYNSSVSFTCDTGYVLSGDTNITCQSNGSWTNVIPDCITVCSPDNLTAPSHGNISYSKDSQPYTEGTVATFQCDTGYTLTGVSTVTCSANGQWIGTIPSCTASSSTAVSVSTASTTDSSVVQAFSLLPTVSMSRSSTTSSTSSTHQTSATVLSTNGQSTTATTAASTRDTSVSSSSVSPSATLVGNSQSMSVATIGAAIGAVIAVLFILVLIAVLVLVFVLRSKRKSGKLEIKKPSTDTAITNPMIYSDLYDSIAPQSMAAASYEQPVTTIRKQPLSDYEEPVQTLKSQYRAGQSGEFSADTAYVQLEDLETEEKSKYPMVKDIYDDGVNFIDDLPPPLFLEDNITAEGGVANSLYFIQEEGETGTVAEPNMEGMANAIYFMQESEHGAPQPVYFTLEEQTESEGTEKSQPVYFTLEENAEKPPQSLTNKRRRTLAFKQPGESETEIYGQIQQSSTPMIEADTLTLSDTIGSGQFGNVCKGNWKRPNGETIDVAVKMLQEKASQQEKIKFLQEAAIMSQFTHSNVIKMYGVVNDEHSPMIVIEYMPKGDLFGVLQKMRPDPGELVHSDTPFLLLSFCRQVCLGMTYLASKGFVHRDLAARNILVSADNICKIIDFGLSRDLEEENYYVSHKGAMIPVKWTAPEALNYRKYSTASDVWSFGCLMYEIWSIGRKPYETYSNITALEKICSDERLPPPPGCPEAIYDLMISCWHPVARERPGFHDIMLILLKQDKNILSVPESALSSHPQAGALGATLKAGEAMYMELQNRYSDGTMDTAL